MGAANRRGVGRDAFEQNGGDGLTGRELDAITYGKRPDLARVDSAIAAKFEITSTGAKVIGRVTEQDIINKLREVSDAKKADFWFYGDMLAFAEDNQWGSIYTQAAAVTGKSEKTLRNYVWVARAIHLSLRGEKGLTLDHYKSIAPMKPGEQQQWIERIQVNGWSSAQLKAAINGDTVPAAASAPKGWQKIEHAILKTKGIDKHDLAERLRRLADQLERNE